MTLTLSVTLSPAHASKWIPSPVSTVAQTGASRDDGIDKTRTHM